MTSLAELFRQGLDNGRLARSKVDEILSRAGLSFEPKPINARVANGAILGVAFYSLYDLEFLDQVVAYRQDRRVEQSAKVVVVFDVLACKAMADFEEIIPGIGPVYQTPVIGVWKDGSLIAKGTGSQGRKLVI